MAQTDTKWSKRTQNGHNNEHQNGHESRKITGIRTVFMDTKTDKTAIKTGRVDTITDTAFSDILMGKTDVKRIKWKFLPSIYPLLCPYFMSVIITVLSYPFYVSNTIRFNFHAKMTKRTVQTKRTSSSTI
jgi:hypothetical protein